MMLEHYALSDAAIVLVAVWAGPALCRRGRLLAGFAMACFGIAAGIGAIRFAGGWQTELAALHFGASQFLGLAGSAALAVACLPGSGKWNQGWLIGAILILAAAIFALETGLFAPITLLAFAIGIAGSTWRSLRSGSSAWIPAGWILLLGNATLVRRAPWLAEAVAWHAYHFLIALALAMAAVGILHDATGSTGKARSA